MRALVSLVSPSEALHTDSIWKARVDGAAVILPTALDPLGIRSRRHTHALEVSAAGAGC